jgi:hypothetical protein
MHLTFFTAFLEHLSIFTIPCKNVQIVFKQLLTVSTVTIKDSGARSGDVGKIEKN